MSYKPPIELEVGKTYFVVSRLIDPSQESGIPFAEALYIGIRPIDKDYSDFVRGQGARFFAIPGVADPIPVKRTNVYNSLEDMSEERTLRGIIIRRTPSHAPLPN